MFNKLLILFLPVFLINSVIFTQSSDQIDNKTKFSMGTQIGMYNEFGGQINLMTSNFAEYFPFSVKLSVGLSYLDPGDALGARKIFINNNTNGIPEKSGKTWNFSMDFLYKYSVLKLRHNYFYAGPRYLMFTGNFNFIGGNEDFDVTSNQWGVGIGSENYFRIIPSIDLVFNLGYDFYFSNTLYGHDTSYSPENDNVNPREEYNFKDADEVINQPKGQIKALMGFRYNLN